LHRAPDSNAALHIERLEPDLRSLVEVEIPRDMSEIYGLTVRTRVLAVREGSIVAFFGVVLSGVAVLSSYADFFDSIHLIRKHAEMLLRRLVDYKYSRSWKVDVTIEYPKLRDPSDFLPWRRFRKRLRATTDDWAEPIVARTRRDGFFWYLLLLNVLLLAAVGWLVSAAVLRTYFR